MTFIQKAAYAVGAITLAVGVLGFVPAITSNNMLLGVFEVDLMHNIVHLLTGLCALGAAWSGAYVRLFFKTFGVVYAIVAILGLALGSNVLGMMMNMPDHVLHVVLAAVFLSLGFATKEMSAPMAPSMAAVPSAEMST